MGGKKRKKRNGDKEGNWFFIFRRVMIHTVTWIARLVGFRQIVWVKNKKKELENVATKMGEIKKRLYGFA